ncbi:MAG: ABC transporter permease subunit [Candidatus Aminicenantes bacterium]|nr:ABC transporter permease subunit [Candidatus Aminicenantes bacterium]
MRPFGCFFILELKRFLTKKNVIVLLLFLLLSLYLVNSGANRYSSINENKEKFQKIEQLKVKQYINYNQYGKYGLRLLFIPSPLSIMFDNSGVFSELTANIDSGEVLRIYNSCKGKTLYDRKAGGFKDFSGVLLLLGSLFALYFGYESFRSKEYLKFLSSLLNHKIVFFSVFISRIILILLFFLFNTGSALLVLKFNNITLSKNEYSHLWLYLLVLFLMLLFFFISGTIIGSFKSKAVALITIISFWFVFVFFIPGTVESIVYKKADNIMSDFHLELEKLKALMKFEKRAIDKEGRFKHSTRNSEQVRELVESYWNVEFKTIRAIEKKMGNDMRDNSNLFQKLSLIFPSTFYLSSCSEVSSRGYNDFIDFYENAQKLKEQFVRFYLNKVYYSNFSTVESFIKGDENIFYADSSLPHSFSTGLLLNGLYLILLLFVSYSRFKNSLFFSEKKKNVRLDELQIKLEKGKCTVCVTSSQQIRDLIFSFFSGRDKDFFSGKVEIDGDEIRGSSVKLDFIYLCHQENIPGDIKVGDFFSFCRKILQVSGEGSEEIKKKSDMKKILKKKFNDLSDIEKGDILFRAAGLKKSRVYIINEIERGMPQTYTNKLLGNLQELKKAKVSILYLSSNLYFTAKVSERMIVPGDERIENILK